jgi:hypothetical protein
MCGRYSITLPPEAIREIFQTHGGCLGHNHAPAPEGRARNYISAIAMNPR